MNDETGSWITRAELYALVWAQPMNKVSEKLGLRGPQLRNLCDAHAIPRPDHGHWLRLEMGKPVTVRPLDQTPGGVAEVIAIIPPRPRKRRLAGEASHVPEDRAISLDVPSRLIRPHAIVAQWIETRRREVEAGMEVYDLQLRRVVTPERHNAADRRRLAVGSTLFKALEKRGVSVGNGERGKLVMQQGTQEIEFQLRYRLRRCKRPLTQDELRWRSSGEKDWKYEFVISDTLVFEIKSWLPRGLQTVWEDGKAGSIEAQLGEIFQAVLTTFSTLEEAARRADIERRQQEILRREQRQREDDDKLERARFRRLLEHAQEWREAELAREFLIALRTVIPHQGPTVGGLEPDEWLAWVERKIEEHDPLASGPWSMLESIAKVTKWTYPDK